MFFLPTSAILLSSLLLINPLPSTAQTTTTAALTSLTSGPVSYASQSLLTIPTCRTLCQTLITAAGACTEDVCACDSGNAEASAEGCLNCLLGASGTSATQRQGIQTGFNAYANLCVSQGYLAQAPVLVAATPTGTTSSSSSSLASSTTTTAAAAATATAGYSAFTTWINLAGNSGACGAACAAVTADYQACTATDTCICTQQNINDGETCQTCVLSNTDGSLTAGQVTNAGTLWARVQSACNLLATTTVLPSSLTTSTTPTTTRRRTTTTSSNMAFTGTAVPSQAYGTKAPATTTATTTSGVLASASPGTIGGGASEGLRVMQGGGMMMGLVSVIVGGAFTLW